MGPLDLAIHLTNFAAPALAVALALTLGARLVERKSAKPVSWPVGLAINFVAGLGASLAGLAWFGQDGRIATYAALVAACATSQWVVGRGWRARG